MLRAVAVAFAVLAVLPCHVAAQSETGRARRAQRPQQRERLAPNGDMLIPFTIGPRNCTDSARLYTVSMRIHNVLAQPVGLPTLAAGASPPVPGTSERPLSNLKLTCGRYLARWSGRHVTTGRRLAPGVYLTELVIDGQRISRKVTLDR
jgi:hypothetical protein